MLLPRSHESDCDCEPCQLERFLKSSNAEVKRLRNGLNSMLESIESVACTDISRSWVKERIRDLLDTKG